MLQHLLQLADGQLTLCRWQHIVKKVPSYWTLDFHEQVAQLVEISTRRLPGLAGSP